jgi:hypothetical protein
LSASVTLAVLRTPELAPGETAPELESAPLMVPVPPSVAPLATATVPAVIV